MTTRVSCGTRNPATQFVVPGFLPATHVQGSSYAKSGVTSLHEHETFYKPHHCNNQHVCLVISEKGFLTIDQLLWHAACAKSQVLVYYGMGAKAMQISSASGVMRRFCEQWLWTQCRHGSLEAWCLGSGSGWTYIEESAAINRVLSSHFWGALDVDCPHLCPPDFLEVEMGMSNPADPHLCERTPPIPSQLWLVLARGPLTRTMKTCGGWGSGEVLMKMMTQ